MVLLSMDGRVVDGDDEESRKFSTGRDSEELGVVDLLLPGAVLGVEEVAGVEVVPCVLLVRSEMLHGGVSATRSLCSLSGIFRLYLLSVSFLSYRHG